jgi:hypothetical protein
MPKAIDAAEWLLRRAREAMSDRDLITAGTLAHAARVALRDAGLEGRYRLPSLGPAAGEGKI